jgi:hypothetical protein
MRGRIKPFMFKDGEARSKFDPEKRALEGETFPVFKI